MPLFGKIKTMCFLLWRKLGWGEDCKGAVIIMQHGNGLIGAQPGSGEEAAYGFADWQEGCLCLLKEKGTEVGNQVLEGM